MAWIDSESLKDCLHSWRKEARNMYSYLARMEEPLSLPAEHIMRESWGAVKAYTHLIEYVEQCEEAVEAGELEE